MDADEFLGCKIALIQNRLVLVYERDTHVRYPSKWDLPGGGREGDETPEACVLRELEEEFGLRFRVDRLRYRRQYRSAHADSYAFFFVGEISAAEVAAIRFGTEGTRWRLMSIDEYLEHPEALPNQQRWLRDYLNVTRDGAA